MANGFALRRNGTCLDSEVSCGATVAPYNVCCPYGSFCSNHYNQVCCQSTLNCTASVVLQPHCGDRSWTLFNNGGVDSGYFCCLNNTFGYSASLSNSNGCGDPNYNLGKGEVPLQSIVQAVTSTSSLASSLSTATATPAATSASSSTGAPAPTVSTGAIVGAVVGGVIALIGLVLLGILLFRRKLAGINGVRSAGSSSTSLFIPKNQPMNSGHSYHLGTMTGLEIDGRPMNELPPLTHANNSMSPVMKKSNEILELP